MDNNVESEKKHLCKMCNQEKPVSEFQINSYKKDKEGNDIFDNEGNRVIASYKFSKGCNDCREINKSISNDKQNKPSKKNVTIKQTSTIKSTNDNSLTSPIRINNNTHVKLNELVKKYSNIKKVDLTSLLIEIAIEDDDLTNKLKDKIFS